MEGEELTREEYNRMVARRRIQRRKQAKLTAAYAILAMGLTLALIYAFPIVFGLLIMAVIVGAIVAIGWAIITVSDHLEERKRRR